MQHLMKVILLKICVSLPGFVQERLDGGEMRWIDHFPWIVSHEDRDNVMIFTLRQPAPLLSLLVIWLPNDIKISHFSSYQND